MYMIFILYLNVAVYNLCICIAVYKLHVYSRQNKIVYNTSKFCGALKTNSVAHPFLWRT